jgi:hypothetical protein
VEVAEVDCGLGGGAYEVNESTECNRYTELTDGW